MQQLASESLLRWTHAPVATITAHEGRWKHCSRRVPCEHVGESCVFFVEKTVVFILLLKTHATQSCGGLKALLLQKLRETLEFTLGRVKRSLELTALAFHLGSLFLDT